MATLQPGTARGLSTLAVSVLLAAAAAACSALLGIAEVDYGNPPSTTDDGGSDVDAPVSTSDAGGDTDIAADASDDGDSDGGTVYHAMSDPGRWEAFDLASVRPGAKGYVGAAFDGRYIYLAPNLDGMVTRYDTQAPFLAGASWSTFNVATVKAGATGYVGAVFDGRYVYFVPFDNGARHGNVARYDTQTPFGAGTSWSTFDVATVNPAAKGLAGGAYDGRYLYLVPFNNGGYDGVAVRYDTQAAFGTGASWSTFDVATVNPAAKGFIGSAYDGRYLYLVPNDNGAPDAVLARYDTRAVFTTAASWSTFDVATVNAMANGFVGAVFDGRYVYLAPSGTGSTYGRAARFDTQAPLDAGASWATFDLPTILNAAAKGFQGAAFDGRYVYLVPFNNGVFDGVVARYDSEASFSSGTAWSTFDITTVNPGAKGFEGAAFDGRYVYLVPRNGGVVARFDAKTPTSIPPSPQGSFL